MSDLPQINHDLADAAAGFLRFFTSSTWATRTEPGADFVAGNPQELPLQAFTDAVGSHLAPQDKDWFAYKQSEAIASQAAAAGLRARSGIPFADEDVQMTTGAFAGLFLTMRTVVSPGEEVLYLTPPWFFYESMVLACGAIPVKVPLPPPSFDLPLGAIAAAITPKTRAVIVNTPHNPTGRIFPEEDLRALADLLTAASAEHGHTIWLISDEAYNRIVYPPNTHVTPAGLYPSTFLVYTYGKQLLTPGQRIGYVALPPTMPDREQVRQALFLQTVVNGFMFPNALMQYAVPEIDDLTIDLEALLRKRDRMVKGLRDAGYDLHVPEGTFYLLPKSPIADDWAFTERLAREQVYVLPGEIVELPGYFRVSVTASNVMIDQALPVFARALEETQ